MRPVDHSLVSICEDDVERGPGAASALASASFQVISRRSKTIAHSNPLQVEGRRLYKPPSLPTSLSSSSPSARTDRLVIIQMSRIKRSSPLSKSTTSLALDDAPKTVKRQSSSIELSSFRERIQRYSLPSSSTSHTLPARRSKSSIPPPSSFHAAPLSSSSLLQVPQPTRPRPTSTSSSKLTHQYHRVIIGPTSTDTLPARPRSTSIPNSIMTMDPAEHWMTTIAVPRFSRTQVPTVVMPVPSTPQTRAAAQARRLSYHAAKSMSNLEASSAQVPSSSDKGAYSDPIASTSSLKLEDLPTRRSPELDSPVSSSESSSSSESGGSSTPMSDSESSSSYTTVLSSATTHRPHSPIQTIKNNSSALHGLKSVLKRLRLVSFTRP